MTATQLTAEAETETVHDIEKLLNLISDPDCRLILSAANEHPVDALELEEMTNIPRSTVYRKVDKLEETPLLEEFTAIDSAGHHSQKYRCQVDELRMHFKSNDHLCIRIA